MRLSPALVSFLARPDVSTELRMIFERLSNYYDIDIEFKREEVSMQDIIVIIFKNHGAFDKAITFRTSGLSNKEIIQAMETRFKDMLDKEEKLERIFRKPLLSGSVLPTLTVPIDSHSVMVNSVAGTINSYEPSVNTERNTILSDLSFAVARELKSRGDFTINVPKFVDLLFKMGVVIAKEDVKTKESEEQVTDEEIPW